LFGVVARQLDGRLISVNTIMIPSKRTSIRAFVICWAAVSLMICSSGRSQEVLRFPSPDGKAPRLISTVDWYKPPAEDPDGPVTPQRVYFGDDFIQNVPRSLHGEATVLLGKADVVGLTQQRAKHFGCQADPDSVLRLLIHKTNADVQGYQKQIADFEAGHSPNPYYSRDEMKSAQRVAQEKRAEINQYQQWIGRLRPYLIKGVALTYLRSGVDGYLIHSKDFVLVFGAVLPREGGHLTMKRMPTVVYLPKKPQRVFTYMHNLD
jgi:hypothetical protein